MNKNKKPQNIPEAKNPAVENKEYCPVCGKVVDKNIFCGNEKCPYRNIKLYS